MKKYKLLILYIIFALLLIITGIVFSILGSSERVGYISEFDLREKNDDQYVYNIRVKYYDEKIFRNSDILGVYVKDFPNAILNAGGSPFGIFTSDKEMFLDDKIDIIYTTKIRIEFLVAGIIWLISILYFGIMIKRSIKIYHYNKSSNKEIYSFIKLKNISLKTIYSFIKLKNISLKTIYSFIKLNKISLIVLLFLTGVFYFMSYFYPLVYDDVQFSTSTIDSIGWKHIKLSNFFGSMASSYRYHGRIGQGFIYLLIHMPFIQAFLSSISILCLYGFFPCIISSNVLNKNRFHLRRFLTFFSIMALLSLLFPWNFYIFNDFFNRTMSLAYVFPMLGFISATIFIWYQIMMRKYIHSSTVECVILFIFGFFISICSDLLTIYGIGMFIGILILASIRYKKFPCFSNSIIFLYNGILVGALVIFSSQAFLSNILVAGGDYSRTNNTNAISLILKEIMPVSVLLLIAIMVVYVIYYFLSKKKKNSSSKEDQIEFIYKSLYLFLVWCGFIIILLIAKVPYFRTLIIAATVLPLVYLLLLGASKIVDTIIVPKFFIVVPVLIIAYSLFIAIHNIDLMNKIIDDFQKQVTIAKETDTDIILPVYDAPFKHIYIADPIDGYIKTSEMGNNIGTPKEKQKEGIRLFYVNLTLNSIITLDARIRGLKFEFYNYDGELSTNQSVTNKY